jgi:GT2 family glycosyltransferase/glycosyltransferase involved in cell wall biosynthesis
MAVRGYVDDMEGSYIVGWAVSVPDGANCVVTVKDNDGNLLAKGRASRHRPDLAVLGAGRTNYGFRIAVPHISEQRALHVLADDEELQGSPIFVGPDCFDGHCAITGDQVTGWVAERLEGFSAPFITVKNHFDIEVARGESMFDDETVDPLFNPAKFALTLDDSCLGSGEVPLTVYANGKQIGHLLCNLTLLGNLDQLTQDRCGGWLVCKEAPKRPLVFDVYRNDRQIAELQCDGQREDVTGLYPDAETPGFDCDFKDEKPHPTDVSVFSFRFPGATREIFDGPYVIAERPAAVEAVHRAARLVNTALVEFGVAEKAVFGQALTEYLAKIRNETLLVLPRQVQAMVKPEATLRLAIVIPVYRGVEITRACIESVLRHRNAKTDLLILVNDASPDTGMAVMLAYFSREPNVLVLTNGENQGFVRSVNRGLSLSRGLNVLLLNSDTVLHAGGIDELLDILAVNSTVGTVTAISNNATIFSYPSTDLRTSDLEDVSWPELAAVALRENRGRFVDVPTGHGFCLLIRADVIAKIGHLDEGFGRGYGEENDFCARAAARGYRNVAAGAVLVEHKESVSFEGERAGLLAQNLPRLNALYPEYTPIVMEFERKDGTRSLRWALDRARLQQAHEKGGAFVLLVTNALEGGTARTIFDVETEIGYAGANELRLTVRDDRSMELSCNSPLISAKFEPSETEPLFDLLSTAAPGQVLVHQLLGFSASFIKTFSAWLQGRTSIFWAHDFYPLCPRVTMIDAIGRFCNVADADTCKRCIGMKGAHPYSALNDLSPAQHREVFGAFLAGVTHVVAPSADSVSYLRRVFDKVAFEVLPHPEPVPAKPIAARAGNSQEVILLGAIGPHKGSHKLLELVERAWLTRPDIHFRIIGYTNIDKDLRAVGNVTITGKYAAEDLPNLLAEADGRLALFLSVWPETYSYALSEAIKAGLVPLVPDIGAPGERVRKSGFGVVFPFPADSETVLTLIDDILAGKRPSIAAGADPATAFRSADDLARYRTLLTPPVQDVAEA